MISLDTETTGIDFRHGARPFFVTMCDEKGNNTFWEWDVDPLTRIPKIPEEDAEEIRQAVEDAERLVLQNGKFDVTALMVAGIIYEWPWEKTEDTLIAGHLLASNQPHDLTSMALIYLDINIKPYEDELKNACRESRKIAAKEYPTWRIAKKGLPEMPSAKEDTEKKTKRGTQGSSPWKFDMWLPRQLAVALKSPKNHLWRTITSEYSNADSSITLSLWLAQKRLLKSRGLWKIYKERIKILPVVQDVESHGMTMSRSRTIELENQYEEDSARCNRTCVSLSDGKLTELSAGITNELRDVIHNHLGLQSNSFTDKGNPSLNKNVIDDWMVTLQKKSKQYTFIKALRAHRKRATALGYIDAYTRFWLPNKTAGPNWYTIYSSLNPTGTDTLRFASENPNSQQISKQEIEGIDDEGEGKSARYMFGPAPGREWWSLDYQNLELRIPAYESNEKVMVELFEKPDEAPYFGSYHLMNASIVYPDLFWPLADQKGAFKKKYPDTYYQWIKNFGFAVTYGAVLGSGTADRAAHKPGAQKLVADKLKEHSKLNSKMIKLAEQQGYVETIPDKDVDPLKGYPLYCSRSSWGNISPTIPLNYHVQGTACWVMMRAMIKVKEYLDTLPGYYIIANVHDELVLDFPVRKGVDNRPKVRKVKAIMESMGNCIDIPLTVGVEHHRENWSKGETLI